MQKLNSIQTNPLIFLHISGTDLSKISNLICVLFVYERNSPEIFIANNTNQEWVKLITFSSNSNSVLSNETKNWLIAQTLNSNLLERSF
jgi:hypothetical protein